MTRPVPTIKPYRLRPDEVQLIRNLTADVISELIEFRTTHDLLKFVRDDGIDNYTELEIRLHNNYPIRASAVAATRSNLNAKPYGILRAPLLEDLPLAPEAISGRLWMYPVDAASAAYAYTKFEQYGAGVTEITRRGDADDTWLGSVTTKKALSDRRIASEARTKLSTALNVPPGRITLRLLRELQGLKRERNLIVHEGLRSKGFDIILIELMRAICRLHFTCVPGDQHITVSPWPDWDDVINRPPTPGVFVRTPA